MTKTDEILAFDWGEDIVGVLDVRTDVYTPYRSLPDRIEGATRVLNASGTIVSWNGARCDLPKIFALLGRGADDSVFHGTHDDMWKVIPEIRWPPDPGTLAITGENLRTTYKYYFGHGRPAAPWGLSDYEADNWRDCFMAAALWKKWKRGELGP